MVSDMGKGKVCLVGAGPGDPDLITKKGLECLAEANVVVYDHLLDEKLLAFTPIACEKIYVGKRASEHAREQDEINKLLVAKASEGKIVVRLKGGDPFVFGRGGEEAETLAENRITFEVVPGVSSAVAVPAYAGIPVTHRGLASSFAVITGHEDPNKMSSRLKWDKLSTGIDTLIFVMGLGNLPEIVAKLIENGRSPDTPVAVIQDGTQSEQKAVTDRLGTICDELKKNPLSPPVIIVVGEVVKLREKLRWFDNRPLSGKRILITRSRQQASNFSKLLTERGGIPVEQPAIKIEAIKNNPPLEQAIMNIRSYDWLLFTSINGVTAFFEKLFGLDKDARAFGGIKIGAIGPATGRALKERGIVPDYIPETFTTQGFIMGLQHRDIAGQRILIPRTDIADRELSIGLTGLGAKVDEVAAYRTTPVTDLDLPVKRMIEAGRIDAVTFTSSSTVINLKALLDKENTTLNGAVVACIGPKTAATAKTAGLKVDIVAKEATMSGLVIAIEEYFTKEK